MSTEARSNVPARPRDEATLRCAKHVLPVKALLEMDEAAKREKHVLVLPHSFSAAFSFDCRSSPLNVAWHVPLGGKAENALGGEMSVSWQNSHGSGT